MSFKPASTTAAIESKYSDNASDTSESDNESAFSDDNQSLGANDEDDDISEDDAPAQLDVDIDGDQYEYDTTFDNPGGMDDETDFTEDLQKIKPDVTQSLIMERHPELTQHSYDEIAILSVIQRDADGNIIDANHRTVPFLTKFERARVLGERAKQLDAGAEPFVELPPNIIDSYTIALREFAAKKIPFIVKRPLPRGDVEYWKLVDLEI